MDVLRRVVIWFSKMVFRLAVFGWILAMVFVMLFGDPRVIKKGLADAKLYEKLPDIVLSQAESVQNGGSLPLDDATVRTVISNTFTPTQLSGYSENFIDGMYAWLEGKSPEPSFSIDLSPASRSIAEGVATQAEKRLAGLPACTEPPTGSLDPFKIECLPPGVDVHREKQRVINEMLASKEFLPDTKITANDLPKSEQGEPFTESFSLAPTIFQVVQQLPWLLLGLAGLSAGIFLWLSLDKRQAVRSLGRMILGSGSLVFVPTALFGVILPAISKDFAPQVTNGSAAPVLNNLLQSTIAVTTRALLIASGIVVVVGVVILVLEHFVWKAAKVVDPSADMPMPKNAEEGADRIIAAQAAEKQKKTTPAETEKPEKK